MAAPEPEQRVGAACSGSPVVPMFASGRSPGAAAEWSDDPLAHPPSILRRATAP